MATATPTAATVLVGHPDAALLYDGKHPGSYKAVLASFEELLGRYGDGERAAIKRPLRQLGSHLNPFARGDVPDGSADVSVDEFFHRLKAAAQAAMKVMTSGQHDQAIQLGLARALNLPKDKKKGRLRQDSVMPFLAPKFKKKVVTALLLDDRYAQLDPDETRAAMMLFVAEFIDEQLKGEGLADQIQRFLAAANKDFLRVLVKLASDYAEEKNPPAHLLDIVRRSATAPLVDQEVFIASLVKRGNFVKIRTKETLTDPDADVKFVNVCMAYTPYAAKGEGAHGIPARARQHHGDPTAGEGKPEKKSRFSYAEMLTDPGWPAMVTAVQARNPDITDRMKEAALSLLGHKSLAKEPVAMIVEFQAYLAEFLETKKALHAIYKFGRPANLVDLTNDLAKFATNPAMAHSVEAGTFNQAYVLKATKAYLELGLPQAEDGTLDLEKSSGLRAAIAKKNRASNPVGQLGPVEAMVMRYCGAIGAKHVNLGYNELGEKGGTVVAEALKTNASLQHLNLGYNKLGEKGGTAVAEALKVNACLLNLNLALNDLGEQGSAAVAEALRTNVSLKELNLRENSLGETGGIAVAEALKINTSLQSLTLWNNKLGEQTGIALVEALKTNTSLHDLDLQLNFGMSEAIKSKIKAAWGDRSGELKF